MLFFMQYQVDFRLEIKVRHSLVIRIFDTNRMTVYPVLIIGISTAFKALAGNLSSCMRTGKDYRTQSFIVS
jgi:hypothetical protein